MASRFPPSSYNGGGGMKDNGTPKENGGAKDNVFDLDSAAFASDEFRMHEFKVKRCPRARPHDWTQCPFAHPGEKARRRDPRRYKYSGTACPEFRKSGCCRRGDACPFAHGVFECWLHPSRYRTQLCTDGTNCKRRVCFFAHVESELRHPDDDPGVAQKQVQAELATEVQTLQQQHLTQALQALLLQSTQPPATTEHQTIQIPDMMNLEMLKQTSEVPPTEMLSTPAVETNNSTAALQLVLLQQLAAKEQQLQQNMSDKSSEVQVSSAPDNGFNASAPSSVTQQPDVYDTLHQLKQLSMSTEAPIAVSTSPAVGPSFDASALLSQLMSNGGTVNGTHLNSQTLLMDSLLTQQNSVNKVAAQTNGQARRSIDNSYLFQDTAPQSVNSVGYPASTFQNAAYLASGVANGVTQDSTTNPGQIPATSNGVYPAVSEATPAMYSVENIQRLFQNPAFSSNLSQLFQMNPALLQQLTATSPTTTQAPGRHSIDNAYLTRLNTDMSRFVNGGMPGMTAPEQTTPVQHDTLMMNGFTHPPSNNDGDKMLQGAIGPEALLQELNALKMQLGNNHAVMAGGRQIGTNGFMSMSTQSATDSEQGTSRASPYPSQTHADSVN